jgi:hypothetical protein
MFPCGKTTCIQSCSEDDGILCSRCKKHFHPLCLELEVPFGDGDILTGCKFCNKVNSVLPKLRRFDSCGGCAFRLQSPKRQLKCAKCARPFCDQCVGTFGMPPKEKKSLSLTWSCNSCKSQTQLSGGSPSTDLGVKRLRDNLDKSWEEPSITNDHERKKAREEEKIARVQVVEVQADETEGLVCSPNVSTSNSFAAISVEEPDSVRQAPSVRLSAQLRTQDSGAYASMPVPPPKRQEVIFTGPDSGSLEEIDFFELCRELHGVCPSVVSNPKISYDFHKVHVFINPGVDISPLLNTTRLCGIEVSANVREASTPVKRIRCKIYGVDKAISEQAIVKELKDVGVVEAKRITYVENERRTETTKVIVVFEAEKIPGRVELGFGKHAVEILEEPSACYKCHSFKHLANACTDRERRCFKCGEGGHLRADCPATSPRCINCSGPHHTLSNACPAKRNAMSDLATRKRNKFPIPDSSDEDAFPLVAPKYPVHSGPELASVSYSTVVRRGVKIKRNSQATSQVAANPPKKVLQPEVTGYTHRPSHADLQLSISAMVNQAVADSVSTAVSTAVAEAVSSMKSVFESMMSGVMSTLGQMSERQRHLTDSIQSLQAQQQQLLAPFPQYQAPYQYGAYQPQFAQQIPPAQSQPLLHQQYQQHPASVVSSQPHQTQYPSVATSSAGAQQPPSNGAPVRTLRGHSPSLS